MKPHTDPAASRAVTRPVRGRSGDSAPLLCAVAQTVRVRKLFEAGQCLLVAVSGGADSVALLLALQTLRRTRGLRLTVAHLHHGIRGRAADADADFVQRLCRRLRLPCVVARCDVPRLARRRGLSLEAAAREARYAFLCSTARELGANAVATAHTADDQAETVVLRFARGAGPEGLAGIPYSHARGKVRIVRPLLDVDRAQVEQFLRARRQAWREDETNRDPSFTRNRVRHDVLPYLSRMLNPGLRSVLRRTAEILREENAWCDDLAARALADLTAGPGSTARRGSSQALDCRQLARLPLALRRRIVRLWLAGAGVPPEHVDFDVVERTLRLCGRTSGSASEELPDRWHVLRRYAIASVEQMGRGRGRASPRRAVPVALQVPGETVLAEFGLRCRVRETLGFVREPPPGAGRYPCRAFIDREVLRARGLAARCRRPGDRMTPLGMERPRKIQDVFVDAKVPRDERDRLPLIVCGREIVWVPGYRVAQGWEVRGKGAPSLEIRVRRLS